MSVRSERDQPRRVDVDTGRDQPRRIEKEAARYQPRRVDTSTERFEPRRVDTSYQGEQPTRVSVADGGQAPRRVERAPQGAPARRIDLSAPADVSGEAAGRGSLTISDKVFERTAAVAATEVDGVGPDQGNGAVQMLGRGVPRASVDRAGSHARVSTTAALRWPSDVPAVADAVRSHVAATVGHVTGSTVDAVDVELADAVRSGGQVWQAEPVTPTPARVPTGPAAAAVVGIVVALVLFAAGVVAVRDAVISFGWVGGSPLLPRFGRWLAGLSADGLVLGLSAACLVVGIIFLVLGLKRRSRPGLSLDSAMPIHLEPRDVARVAAAAADQVDGVQDASAHATKSKVSVTVKVTGETQEISDAVTEEVTRALSAVRTRRGGSGPRVTTTMKGI